MLVNRSNWVLGVQALHHNPFDGHILSGAIRHLVGMTGVLPERIFVDKGYKGPGQPALARCMWLAESPGMRQEPSGSC